MRRPVGKTYIFGIVAAGVAAAGAYALWPSAADEKEREQSREEGKAGTRKPPRPPTLWETITGTGTQPETGAGDTARRTGAPDKKTDNPDRKRSSGPARPPRPRAAQTEITEKEERARRERQETRAATQEEIRRLRERFRQSLRQAVEERKSGNYTYRETNEAGQTIYSENYRQWKLNDHADGSPALQKRDESGNLLYTEHYRDGALHDAPDGNPAVMMYDKNGTVISAQRFFHGNPDGDLTRQELDALNAALRGAARQKAPQP